MATRYWLGKATAVAQVGTIQITAYDAATTYKLVVNGETIASTSAQGSANATASALNTAWNNSTNPYATPITTSVSTDTITFTADNAGVPFTVSGSVTGGTGTIGSYTATTANSGPNDWSTAANWSGDTVPTTGDTVIIKDTAVSILWGLAQSGVTLADLQIHRSFTGYIGLNHMAFLTNATTSTTAKTEYRAHYLAISATLLTIGENLSSVTPTGSTRIKIDLGSNASTIMIIGTAASSAETGRPSIRLLNVHASSTMTVRSAPGGVGVAAEVAGEVSTLSKIQITDTSTETKVLLGSGVTLTTWEQQGGTNAIGGLAATITTMNVLGGTLRTEGDYTITTVNQYGGTVYSNHIKTGGNCVTTYNLFDGVLDLRATRRTRTIATLAVTNGTFWIPDDVAVTTLQFTGERFKVTVESTG